MFNFYIPSRVMQYYPYKVKIHELVAPTFKRNFPLFGMYLSVFLPASSTPKAIWFTVLWVDMIQIHDYAFESDSESTQCSDPVSQLSFIPDPKSNELDSV